MENVIKDQHRRSLVNSDLEKNSKFLERD